MHRELYGILQILELSGIAALHVIPPKNPNKRPNHQGGQNPSYVFAIRNVKVFASVKNQSVDQVGQHNTGNYESDRIDSIYRRRRANCTLTGTFVSLSASRTLNRLGRTHGAEKTGRAYAAAGLQATRAIEIGHIRACCTSVAGAIIGVTTGAATYVAVI